MPWAPIWTDSVWGGRRCGTFGVGGALLGGACIELSRPPAVSYESDRSMSSPSRLTGGTPWGGGALFLFQDGTPEGYCRGDHGGGGVQVVKGGGRRFLGHRLRASKGR